MAKTEWSFGFPECKKVKMAELFLITMDISMPREAYHSSCGEGRSHSILFGNITGSYELIYSEMKLRMVMALF